MEVNYTELDQYSKAFARRLTDYYFIDNSFIEGKSILSFCDIKQVNLLVIKNLFERWQEETSRLKSPYFNYENDDVQEALNTFMNVLSKHIFIEKEKFYPLLVDATQEAILLIINPKEFYINELHKPKNTLVNIQQFEDIQKYIQFNKELLKSFVRELKIRRQEEINREEALNSLEEAYQQYQPYIEPMDWRLRTFSDIFALDAPRLFSGNSSVSSDYNYEDATQVIQEEPTVIYQAEEKETKPLDKQEDIVGDEKEVYTPPAAKSEEDKAYIAVKKEKNTIYEETYNPIPENNINSNSSEEEEKKTLNDVYQKQQESNNILKGFQQAKLENIRSAMPLNQRFQFINKLFQGDQFAFNDAIDKIETCRSYEEARQWINNEYALKFQWDFETQDVEDFFEIVQRRFS